MKILVLSFYFKPDLCAGSFRTTALVEALSKEIAPDDSIEILTTLPNRYGSFSIEAPVTEIAGNISVTRIELPRHQSGMVDQAKAFIVYARTAMRLVKTKQYDLVFATSSRLMTASLGAWIARRKGVPLYLDIRDIFVDTIRDVLPQKVAMILGPLFSLLERWTINNASKVNLVSKGFEGYFQGRYPEKHFSYFTNGIDDEFLSLQAPISESPKDGIVRVLYAGNLGEGQGLHAIIPELAERMRGRVAFKIIGDGGRREALLEALQSANVDNVELLPPMGRQQLIQEYQIADVLFLHLNDYEAFKKVLPSKLFEYGAMNKPIWAGVAGYAAEFVRAEVKNAAVFYPCDAGDAVRAFSGLCMRTESRVDFIEKFSRANIAKVMARDILATI
ncbi:MAG: glycosyltransferase WbuB [Sideroxydans sp.]|nr:glycosyltransferase WbuB [Sideroxydans sp.]